MGLHYNRFRYYDPHCGRFVSRDLIGLAGGVNIYQYAPNAVQWVDPLGLVRISKKVKCKVGKENKDNFGVNKCEVFGAKTIPAQKSRKGVSPQSNEVQYNHIIADAEGDSNDEGNV